MDGTETDGEAVRLAEFALQRAQSSAYYATKYLAERRGDPEARQAFREAQARCEEALRDVRRAEAGAQKRPPTRAGVPPTVGGL